MAIRKKISGLFLAIILFFLLTFYIFMYFYFHNTVTAAVVERQEAQVMANRHLASNFMNNLRQITIHFISDRAIGSQLSSPSTEPMEQLQVRAALQSQFSHYSLLTMSHDVNSYRYTLFLNDQLPISSMFEARTLSTNPYSTASSIFTNTLVKDDLWYKNTLEASNYTCVFNNESSGELCLAKKIQNTSYTGPYYKDGQAVMVISIKMPYIDSVFGGIPPTPNSGYALLDKKGQLLYASPSGPDHSFYTEALAAVSGNTALYQAGTGSHHVIGGEPYLVNFDDSDQDITLLSLTPYSDINRTVRPVMVRFSVISLLITLCAMAVIFTASDRITRPIILLSEVIGSITDTRTFDLKSLHVSKDREIVSLEESFTKLIINNNRLIHDVQAQEIRQKNSELKALQAQIDPHFIFNAMDAVNWIALTRDQDDLAEILASIANLMRYSIMEADQLIPLTKELSNIGEYIAIYKLRHQGDIRLSVPSKDASADTLIPKFALQPLVENSIRYGGQPTGTAIEITVSVTHEADRFILEVSDNGQGCDPDLLNEYLAYKTNNLKVTNGFGIRNVNDRIRLHFGPESGLKYYVDENNRLTARAEFKYREASAAKL